MSENITLYINKCLGTAELLRQAERGPRNLVTANGPGMAILFTIPGEDFQ